MPEGRACGPSCCGGAAPSNAPACRLTDLRPGSHATVCETCLEPSDGELLRAMGLGPNASIRLCRVGEPCIVEVLAGLPAQGQADCRCRIGLTRELAARVRVIPGP